MTANRDNANATLARPRTGTYASRPAANTVPFGFQYTATDVKESYQSDGSSWRLLPGAGALLAMAEVATTTDLSTTRKAIPGLSFTFTAGEKPVSVEYGGSIRCNNDAATASVVLTLVVNGTDSSQIVTSRQSDSYLSPSRRSVVGPFTPGSQVTIRVDGYTTAGTGNLIGVSNDKPYLYAVNL